MSSSSNDVRSLKLEPAEVQFYKDEGYLYLGGLLDESVVANLRREVLEVVCASHGLTPDALRRAGGAADKLRQSAQYLEGSLLHELIHGQAVLDVASQLIDGRAIMYSPFTAVKAGGGGGTFHYHQDNNYTQHDPATGSLNIWIALDEMTPDNGCLRIVPRSHLQGQIAARQSDDGDQHQQIDVDPLRCLPIRMRAGDAVAFTRWTVHGSGPNHTDQPRVAYALQCHREDVCYIEKETGERKRLVDHPLWELKPVRQLEPTGR